MRPAFGRTFWLGALVASLALGACQSAPLAPNVKKSTAPRNASPQPGLSPAPAVASPVASPVAPALAAPLKLQRPAGEVTRLAGVLSLDAGYLIATGGGTAISDNGAGLVAIGAGSLISNHGGGVVTTADGRLLASGAGNLISDRGAALLGPATYRVAQAAPLAAGTELPAVGMAVRAYAMTDDSPLSLGTAPDGRPVYEILTNAQGAFELFLPTDLKGHNIRLEATPPGPRDERLVYERVDAFGTAEAATIAEDTRLVARYLRQAFGVRFRALIWGAEAPYYAEEMNLPDDMQASAAAISNSLNQAALAAGLPTAGEAAQRRAGQRAADAVLAYLDLSGVVVADGTPVVAQLTRVLREIKLATAAKLQADPDFFVTQPYVARANLERGAGDRLEIKKPSDLPDFLLAGPLTGLFSQRNARTKEVLTSIALAEASQTAMIDAMDALASAFILEMLVNEQASQGALAALKRPLD